MGCSDFFVGNEMRSRKFSKNLVVPAKAGIHSEVARANSLWIPAFAGTTEGYTRALPTKYPDEPENEARRGALSSCCSSDYAVGIKAA
jgi:hypothetical protein